MHARESLYRSCIYIYIYMHACTDVCVCVCVCVRVCVCVCCLPEHSAGSTSTFGTSQPRSTADRQVVLAFRLVNSSNTCYMHAFLTAWLWSSWPYQSPMQQVSDSARECLISLLEAPQPYTILDVPCFVLGRIHRSNMILRSSPMLQRRPCPLTVCSTRGSLVFASASVVR